MVKEGIIEITGKHRGMLRIGIVKLLDEQLGAFQVEVATGRSGCRTPSFQVLMACGAPKFIVDKEPIDSRLWIIGMENAH